MKTAGLYIHIPFCRQACDYCNFHFSTNLTYIDRMVSAICKEIELKRELIQAHEIATLYLGGGTPSLLSVEQISQMIDTLPFSPEQVSEFTIEANPDDVSEETLEMWKSLGCRRVSLGVQSFEDEILKWMNRSHHVREARNALSLLSGDENLNFSLDLIYGYPALSEEKWESDIQEALSYDPVHLSAYQLTVEPRTRLAHRVKKQLETMPDDGEVRAQFVKIMAKTSEGGYEHYEISSFAKKGYRAIHNSNYWNGNPYIGIGPGAHSYDTRSRRWNVNNNHRYMKALEDGVLPEEKEKLSRKEQYNEVVMLKMRTMEGINRRKLTREFPEFMAHFEGELAALRKLSWLEEEGDRLSLSKEGIHFCDRVSSSLMLV